MQRQGTATDAHGKADGKQEGEDTKQQQSTGDDKRIRENRTRGDDWSRVDDTTGHPHT
jgi:hypothetical protein